MIFPSKANRRLAGLILGAWMGSAAVLNAGAKDAAAFDSGICGLWLMGQSLAEGAESVPIVTEKSSDPGNLRFQRGVRTWTAQDRDPAGRPEADFELTPLSATTRGNLGETVANGMADHLRKALAEGMGKKTPGFLVAYAGQGGRFIDELSIVDQAADPRTPENRRGGGYYQTSLDDARRAMTQAAARNEKFGISALIWMQGEANGGAGGGIKPSRWEDEILPPAGLEWYRDRLIAFRRQWSQDLRAITGQTRDLPLFTYQTQGPAGTAQIMASDADPLIHVVGPHYAVPNAINSRRADGKAGDPVHLAADGERMFGEQIGKVVRRVLLDDSPWQPLRPKKAWLGEGRSEVFIQFEVPCPPLVLDTRFLAQQKIEAGGGFTSLDGFQVRSEGGPRVIRNVEVCGPDTVRIVLAAALPEGKKASVRYGHPNAGSLGKISRIQKDGDASTLLFLEGDLREHLEPLLDEGAFFVANELPAPKEARAPVRGVEFAEGSTALRVLDQELRGSFEAGQPLVARRPFSYGNLRDSDSEESVYAFADSSYGRRAGQPYPLWNWCVLFPELEIADSK